MLDMIETTDQRYNRYMVFTWSEYDNVSPFECVEETFSEKDQAIKYAHQRGNKEEDGTLLYTVFDRVEGKHLI